MNEIQQYNDFATVRTLNGEWAFSLGGQTGVIQVPGCWEAQGYARRSEGPAQYRHVVDIPAEWRGQRVQLQFDAISYHAEIAVNGQHVGEHTGSWSPFAVDVSHAIRPGQPNEIVITVTKPGERFPVRESLVGFLPDVMLMFGGLWQSARLVAFPGPSLAEISILSDPSADRVTIEATAYHMGDYAPVVRIIDPNGRITLEYWPAPGPEISADLPITNARRWSPDDPALYTVEIALESARGATARVRRKFGLRELAANGQQLTLNGIPICLRGALNWGWYPERLCPAPDDATIRDEFRRARALGFNLIKLCLFVPAPRYFEIADEEGMLLWLELPMWLPQVTPRLREQAPREYAEILAAVHHHPSVVICSLGCELNQAVDADLLGQLDQIARSWVRGALYCDNSGSGEAYGGLGFDFADFNDYHFYADLHYFEPLVDHFRRDWRNPRPWIFGEFCDADDYRDIDEIAAAMPDGKLPWWLTELNPLHAPGFVSYPFQGERMARLWPELGLTAQDVQRISRQQSFVVRKAILEKVRARVGMGGYVVTGLRDTPLATSAAFDDLGRSKYDAAAFRAFNADTVLLIGQGRQRIWRNGGDRPVYWPPQVVLAGHAVELTAILANAGGPYQDGVLRWLLHSEAGDVLGQGEIQVEGLPTNGYPAQIGAIRFVAPHGDQARALHLELALEAGMQTITNRWPLWVFPDVREWPETVAVYDPAGSLTGLDDLYTRRVDRLPAPDAGHVVITNVLDEAVRAFLQNGGTVCLLQRGPGPLAAGARPFWRESIHLLADHPIPNALAHAGHVDMQFYGLASDHTFEPDVLADLGDADIVARPMRRLDARQFTLSDYIIEGRVGRGRLLATTLNVMGGAGDQPAGLWFNPVGRWLLSTIFTNLTPNPSP